MHCRCDINTLTWAFWHITFRNRRMIKPAVSHPVSSSLLPFSFEMKLIITKATATLIFHCIVSSHHLSALYIDDTSPSRSSLLPFFLSLSSQHNKYRWMMIQTPKNPDSMIYKWKRWSDVCMSTNQLYKHTFFLLWCTHIGYFKALSSFSHAWTWIHHQKKTAEVYLFCIVYTFPI